MSKREAERNIEIRNIVLMITITAVIGLITFMLYFVKSGERYVAYDERSEVNYTVSLDNNEFYKKNTLDKNQAAYVGAIVNHILANFRYKLDFYEKLAYRYSYDIIADVELVDKSTGANVYHYTEDLKKMDLREGSGLLIIDEDVNIDYKKYISLVDKFQEVYGLSNMSSTLKVRLIANVQNINKSDTIRFVNQEVCSLSIPLTNKAVTIDVKDGVVSEGNRRIETETNDNYDWILMISSVYIFIAVLYIIYLINYVSRTKTAKMIYDKEIKSIMNHYSSYIQKINGSYDIGTSQVIKIETFSDMLEIRDTLKQPILMLENEKGDGSFFIIPATNSIIYTYALRVVDIKAKMAGHEIPTYDITEIPQGDFVKKKKYTDKFIKEQITMTTAMPVVDEKNVIKGSKDKEKGLYDQLEMTRSFDVSEIRRAAKEAKKTAKKTKKTTKKEVAPKKKETTTKKKVTKK